MGTVTPPSTASCRLCGSRLRESEDLVRLGTELFHVACAEPTLSDSPAWRERQIGTLHQLAEGVGRSTVV